MALAAGAVEGNGPGKIQRSNIGRLTGLDGHFDANVPL